MWQTILGSILMIFSAVFIRINVIGRYDKILELLLTDSSLEWQILGLFELTWNKTKYIDLDKYFHFFFYFNMYLPNHDNLQ